MPVKCGGCGKFLSAVETARCTKCGVPYHRVCVGLPTKGPLVSAWNCPECKKNVRRDNKAETPIRGCVAGQGGELASASMPTPSAVATLEPVTPTGSAVLVHPTTPLPTAAAPAPLSTAASPTALTTAAPLTPQSVAAPLSPLVVETLLQVLTPPPIVTALETSEFPHDIGPALKLVVEELRTLRFEVMELRKDVAELKASNDSSHTRMDGIESRLEALEMLHDAGSNSTNLSTVESVVLQLKRDLNDRDQELMANDLMIANVPESQAENPTHLFQLIATKLGVI